MRKTAVLLGALVALSACSSTTTSTTTITGSPPSITGTPQGQGVVAGDPVTFTASANGSPTPTVQWQLSTDGGTTYANVDGATSTTLTFVTTIAEDGDRYRAVFTNTWGIASTRAALLAVTTERIAPAVVIQPADQSVLAGETVLFTAAASGSPLPAVQWQDSTDGVTFANVIGGTTGALSFSAETRSDGHAYRAVFTNSSGTATSQSATLHVGSAAPAVTLDPVSQTVANGATVTFTADAVGNPTPDVVWEESTDSGATWTAISGATTRSYSFTATTAQNGWQFHAVFANSSGTATSQAATLTVTP